MSQKELIDAICQQAHIKTDEVLGEAKERAKTIVRKAESETGKIKEGIIQRAVNSVKSEEAKIINEARLSAKKELLVAKHQVIDKVMESLKKRIEELPGKKEYPFIFESLLRESLNGASGPVLIRCMTRDRKLAEKFAQEASLQATIEESLKGSSGVEVLWGENSQFIRKNSFDDRMTKIYAELLKEANSMIFGKKNP